MSYNREIGNCFAKVKSHIKDIGGIVYDVNPSMEESAIPISFDGYWCGVKVYFPDKKDALAKLNVNKEGYKYKIENGNLCINSI